MDEEKVIDVLAKAACVADGHEDIDASYCVMTVDGEVVWPYAWLAYVAEARRYYAMHKARKAFNAQQFNMPEKA